MSEWDNLYDRDVFCPFYKGTERDRTIKCEGPYDRTVVRMTLNGKRRFDAHRHAYCNSRECEKCRIYQCVMKKYEEE